MKLTVLYIEDELDDRTCLEQAFTEHNAAGGHPHLDVRWATHPREVESQLSSDLDVIIADVFYWANGTDEFGLDKILKDVVKWCDRSNGGRLLPVIAYTGKSHRGLELCLEHSDHLFDIWDKAVASSSYVVWRLGELAQDLSRIHSDVYLQRRIRLLEAGATFHGHVVDMAIDYNAGWTEADQIERATPHILTIGNQLGALEETKDSWQAMREWESLGRSALPNTRGHARHVINVFWLGYVILHEPDLSVFFDETWRRMVKDRPGMSAVEDENPMEALSAIWFFASLFHDIAGCVEKYGAVRSYLDGVIAPFGDQCQEPEAPACLYAEDRLPVVLSDLSAGIRGVLSGNFVSSVKAGKPDHGVVAADYWHTRALGPRVAVYCREAARAMAVHNLVDALPQGSVSWESEPMSALLVLCDQLQTWDRQREDLTLQSKDGPDRAELVSLEFENEDGLRLSMGINYVTPPHVARVSEIRQRVRAALQEVILEKPANALHRLTAWPFALDVAFELNGDPLTFKIHEPS